jgi:diguanylate cyclase (GGDEF)-like protein
MAVRSLRARIATFFVVLLVIVQGIAAVLVSRASSQIARDTIDQALEQGERIFRRLLAQNQSRLEQGAAILSADFAFRQAIATNNVDTIASVLRNHGARMGANAMLLLSLDRIVRADAQGSERIGKAFPFPGLIEEAASEGRASAVALFDGRLHQLVVVPVLAPEPIAWVGLAFAVDDDTAREMSELTGLEVSFLSRAPQGHWMVHASTLEPPIKAALGAALPLASDAGRKELVVGGEEFETRVASLRTPDEAQVVAALQRPLAEGLLPFRRIDKVFFWLAVLSLAMLVVGSLIIARGITQPVKRLADAAKRIQRGDYAKPVEVEQKDEIGELAVSFNHMLDGIKSREKEILRLAYEDGLTALPNRAMFNEQLDQAVKTARRTKEPLAVMLLDMDRFKAINDTLGHPVGDQALREVGARVRAALRESDIVSRLGGDEFAVLLATGDAERAPQVAGKILKSLERPLVIDGQSMDIAASIGIAHFPQHGGDAAALLRAADVAMYVAKRNKGGGFAVYDPGHDERRQEHLSLLGELRQAVENDQLVLHYQPKVTIADGKVGAVEALVRWDHPLRGFIAPGDFIPFAEQTGYISSITSWVLRRAIHQCGQWHRGGLQLRVSVNVSARDLRNEDALVDDVAAALRFDQVPAALLCLEITESGLMEDPGSAQSTLRRLRELGVSTSIDDYGTGYSSLAYIKQLPVSEIKIDRAFVSGMEADRRNAAIVRSTIELGHNLGLTVVAEGVETDHELAELNRFGCDVAQGFLFAHPMPAEELLAWLSQQGKD